MDDSKLLEIYCPNCRQHVVPLKAAVSWYCPSCAWQFNEAEIERGQGAGALPPRPADSRPRPPRS